MTQSHMHFPHQTTSNPEATSVIDRRLIATTHIRHSRGGENPGNRGLPASAGCNRNWLDARLRGQGRSGKVKAQQR